MDNIQLIKNTLSIEQYLTNLNNKLKKTGNSLSCNPCPLCGHKDCFRVTPSKQLFRCFSCGKGGDVIELHKEINNLSLNDAITDLAQKFNINTAVKKNNQIVMLRSNISHVTQ